ncbi:Extradiol ring-cleavage dioxygenase class III enzyme subunit B domain-containing protein [Tumidithrix helvetica PCC 7403]|uniref:DODA-type extradiol aromatic ring-opening family dioxygenase n=1 Tax=Tumidithrix helvetica TaxID=3457545 RepID=UPI003CAA797B
MKTKEIGNSSIFISHGSPELPLRPSPVRDFLLDLGKHIETPKAILAISAHWNTAHPIVSSADRPETIHDFGGFPPELYQLQYPAPGAPQLADRVSELLAKAGFKNEISPNRGLDHGAWNPLMLIYPEANIPVTQLSIQPHLDAAYHFRLGQTLEPLRQEGVLILASGSTTHNLREIGGNAYDANPPIWVSDFTDWLTGKAIAGDTKALLDYQHLAPYAQRNHPSAEHLLPFFVAMGAGGKEAKALPLHSSYTYGVLSMAAFLFYA